MRRVFDIVLPVLGLALLAGGTYVGLVVAPPDRDMGDVYRIIYVHVPSAWAAMAAFTIAFGASLVYLFKSSWAADAVAEASAEVGVLFTTLLIVQGSIWAKPTWNVWWTWDPRLTTAAILLFAFAGYLALRRFVDDPERRATWAAVAAIIIYMDVPVVYFSVRWWRSIHQLQSTARSVNPTMALAWGINALAFLMLCLWFIRLRYRISRRRQMLELTEPGDAEPARGAA